MSRILVVDDEESMQRLIGGILSDAGYEAVCAGDGVEAVKLAQSWRPDLVVMDVMLPRLDGFGACRKIREMGLTMPIVFLSAKGDIVDKGIGFQAGGDDYMTKPFDPRELVMHIDAHLRRSQMTASPAASPKPQVLRVGRLEVDERRFSVRKDGRELTLTPKEFKILLTLAQNSDMVLSKAQIVEAAWGKEFVGETTSITVFIKKLREKVEDDPSDPQIIQTVWGIGYKLVTE